MQAAGMVVNYTYDILGRLNTVQKDTDNPALYAYDNIGRRTSLTLPNGVQTTYAYDTQNRLVNLETKKDANILAAFAYTVDATGNRTAIDMHLNGTQNRLEYSFDDAYRLTNEIRKDAGGAVIENEAFTYDAVGNRLTKAKNGALTTNTYNNANQLMTSVVGSVTKTYGYDANGNNISVSDSALNVTMTYDALNRQTSWTDGTNTEATLFRGASWHRTRLSANGNATDFLYDGDDVVSDMLAGGTVQKQYVTAGLDQNLSMSDVAAANTYFYSQDGLGSIRILTDASGIIQNNYDYTAFGEFYTPNTISNITQRYAYTGRENQPLSQTMYYRYRNYDTNIGRFAWRDPSGYRNNENGNLYSYVSNQSLVLVDPYGLIRWRWWKKKKKKKNCYCCCVESLTIKNKKKIDDSYNFGHSFDTVIKLEYKKWKKKTFGDCSYSWQEKTDKPYAIYTRPNIWYEMTTNPNTINSFKAWGSRKKPTPGTEVVTDNDQPTIGKWKTGSNGKNVLKDYYERTLEFKITVTSASGCVCTNKSLTIKAKQVLVVRRGTGIRSSFQWQ
jgi:RHS repeat-associated protein